MERIVEAGMEFVEQQRKALALVSVIGAMIVLPFIIGAPNQGLAHNVSPCTSNCNYSCILTGHAGGGFCCTQSNHCQCH